MAVQYAEDFEEPDDQDILPIDENNFLLNRQNAMLMCWLMSISTMTLDEAGQEDHRETAA